MQRAPKDLTPSVIFLTPDSLRPFAACKNFDNSCLLRPLPEMMPERPHAPYVRESIRILVADDDPVFLRVTTTILNRLGFRVLAARDGDAALKAFEESPHTIQLVVSDVTMPGVTGPQLVRAIRSVSPSIASLLMSGTPATASGAGASVLLKPFTVAGFISNVENLLAGCDFAEIEREQSAARSRRFAATAGTSIEDGGQLQSSDSNRPE